MSFINLRFEGDEKTVAESWRGGEREREKERERENERERERREEGRGGWRSRRLVAR